MKKILFILVSFVMSINYCFSNNIELKINADSILKIENIEKCQVENDAFIKKCENKLKDYFLKNKFETIKFISKLEFSCAIIKEHIKQSNLYNVVFVAFYKDTLSNTFYDLKIITELNIDDAAELVINDNIKYKLSGNILTEQHNSYNYINFINDKNVYNYRNFFPLHVDSFGNKFISLGTIWLTDVKFEKIN